MLIKKELLTVAVGKPHKIPKKSPCQTSCAVAIVELPRSGRVLVLDLFSKAGELILRFFSDGVNAISADGWPDPHWFSTLPASVYDSQGKCYSTPEDNKKTLKLLGRRGWRDDAYGMANDFIRDRYEQQRERDNERKQELWRKHRAMYPALPKGLDAYCERYVFPQAFIFIGKKQQGVRTAVCSHCGHTYTLTEPVKSGGACSCPKCKRRAKYRGDWLAPPATEKARICIAQKVKGQVLMRWTTVYREFHPGSIKPTYDYEDYCYNLHLMENGKETVYCYKWQSVMGFGWDWYRKRNGDTNYERTFIYTGNLKAVFGDRYRVDLAGGLRGKQINFERLLDGLTHLPAAEYLFKMGLPTLASQVHSDNIGQGMGFSGILGISKQYLPLYRKYDPTFQEHLILKEASEWVGEVTFQKMRELDLDYGYGALASIRQALETMSFARFINYFHKQKVLAKCNANDLISDYCDYIAMCRELGVDLSHKSVRFPSDLKASHDLLVERMNRIKMKKANAAFKKATKELHALLPGYGDGGYCILLPAEASDIVTEGQSLHHCVGGQHYIERHMQGKRIILFVRRAEAPTKPYFTMEFDRENGVVLQLRGHGNCAPPKEVKAFVDRFVRSLKHPVRKAG